MKKIGTLNKRCRNEYNNYRNERDSIDSVRKKALYPLRVRAHQQTEKKRNGEQSSFLGQHSSLSWTNTRLMQ